MPNQTDRSDLEAAEELALQRVARVMREQSAVLLLLYPASKVAQYFADSAEIFIATQ